MRGDRGESSEECLAIERHGPVGWQPAGEKVGAGGAEDAFFGFHHTERAAAERAPSSEAKRPSKTVRNAGETKAASRAWR
jgi:hypothetical protein